MAINPEISRPPLAWYALRVRSNFEKNVHDSLRAKEYESFLPTYRCRRRWSDRVKKVDAPLFQGYTFCRFDPSRRLPILITPGVISIVGYSLGPAPIDDIEIDSIRTMAASGVVGPWPFLREGETVVVECGPLAGIEGIIISFKNQYRLVVSISLLQRSVAVEIDRGSVRPIAKRHS